MSARRRARNWLCLVVLVSTGCAASPDNARSVVIAPGVALELPAPTTLGAPREAVQRLTARRADLVLSFEGHVSLDSERLLLVGTDPLGRRAMTITWTGNGWAASTAPGLPETLRPENVLADMVLMYGPAPVVRDALRPAGATLETDGRSRTVRRSGDAIVTITYEQSGDPWSGLTRLRNLAWGYELEVRSVVIRR